MEHVRWEYKIINIRSENYRIDPAKESELNLLGDEGWELVAMRLDAVSSRNAPIFYFKRPKS